MLSLRWKRLSTPHLGLDVSGPCLGFVVLTRMGHTIMTIPEAPEKINRVCVGDVPAQDAGVVQNYHQHPDTQ